MIMVVTKRIWDLSHPKHLLNTVGPQHSSTYSRPGISVSLFLGLQAGGPLLGGRLDPEVPLETGWQAA